jgi:hypothetical protein
MGENVDFSNINDWQSFFQAKTIVTGSLDSCQ